MKKILITLTSSESKRLIAKYVSQMPMVKKTMAEGILNLQLSTTNGFMRNYPGMRLNVQAMSVVSSQQQVVVEHIYRRAIKENSILKKGLKNI